MANKRYDLITVVREYEHNGETKKVWANIGTAWERENGGFSIALDLIPTKTNDKGQVSCLMVEPKPRDGNSQSSGRSGGSAPAPDDDDIPF